jgi:hypothetical protein
MAQLSSIRASLITRHSSLITHHTSHITHHTSHITKCHQPYLRMPLAMCATALCRCRHALHPRGAGAGGYPWHRQAAVSSSVTPRPTRPTRHTTRCPSNQSIRCRRSPWTHHGPSRHTRLPTGSRHSRRASGPSPAAGHPSARPPHHLHQRSHSRQPP